MSNDILELITDDSLELTSIKKVDKVWGKEYWLVNEKEGNYCCKVLRLDPEHQASLHYHQEKCETFKILSGKCIIEKFRENGDYYHFKIHHNSDSPIKIEPYTRHRFIASTAYPCYILEVSTFHDDADTVRIAGEESR